MELLNIPLPESTIVRDLPTEERPCSECGQKMDAEWSLHFRICRKCLDAIKFDGRTSPTFERDKKMECCGKGFELYYNRITCRVCGFERPAGLGDLYKDWGKK